MKHKAMCSLFGLSIKTWLFIKSQIESASHGKGNVVSQYINLRLIEFSTLIEMKIFFTFNIINLANDL